VPGFPGAAAANRLCVHTSGGRVLAFANWLLVQLGGIDS
jgi:hypothetical protein